MPRRDCCRRAELEGLQRYGHRLGSWTIDSAATARKVVRLGKRVWGEAPTVRSHRSGQHYRFLVAAPPRVLSSSPLSGLFATCCRRAYLRGCFLACGWVADPGRGCHLELAVSSREEGEVLLEILAAEELTARLGPRPTGCSVYLKDGDQVSRFLTLTGAYGSVMRFENVRALKEVKNLVNRLVNADTANVAKAVEASVRQAEDIRAVLAAGMWERLPRALREVALVRLRHPEASLRELGELLVPPVGKSGVNHRLRRLRRWAQQARAQGTSGGIGSGGMEIQKGC